MTATVPRPPQPRTRGRRRDGLARVGAWGEQVGPGVVMLGCGLAVLGLMSIAILGGHT